ncbi:hypothetical protein MKJ04_05670 [Pontibacter sp. E15-1]|uniref:hypothetical protein n=1 Tax=Pontibacter sp. E15-1 TaxID=2919918 RepID=UPI001F4FE1F5|nr:hypothetical protein [Pontibacter sp. E15-1]MCJ8164324.1 hypothetical protein [Pontibacter sp. E15-1]
MKKQSRDQVILAAAAFATRSRGCAKWLLQALLCLLLLSEVSCQGKQEENRQATAQSDPAALADSVEAAALPPPDSDVVDGIHVPTGLIADEGYVLVRNNCISCHSLNLVKNKRATREGWLSTIRWMQQTQGLWDLGENEKPILDYLARNYAPDDMGRRKQLTEVEWYILKE